MRSLFFNDVSWTSPLSERKVPIVSSSKNVVVAGTSYQMYAVLSFCYRERY